MPNALITASRPTDHLAAKFSMEFCIAILLLRGRAGLTEFRDEVVRDPVVRATIEKVRFEVDPEADAAGYNNMTSIIRVRLKGCREIEGRAAFAKGSPANPMSEQELRQKFLDCLEAGGVGGATGRAADLILDLESQTDLRAITRLLSADAAARAQDDGGLMPVSITSSSNTSSAGRWTASAGTALPSMLWTLSGFPALRDSVGRPTVGAER